MRGTGRGKSGRGGTGCGRGNFRGRGNSGTTSQPQIQSIGINEVPLEIGQSSNPSQGTLQSGQISCNPLQRTSPETQSSRNLEENACPSPEAENGAVSRINKKRGRGKYKSKTVDIKTKYGGKITIMIPDDIDRAVGSGARDIVNYSGLIMRTYISFREGKWQKIVLKYGEAMWLQVKNKFEVCGGLREHKLQGFVISSMQRLFRAWKARLHTDYLRYSTDEERLSHRPEDVQLEDWKYLVKYFGSEEFKRDPVSGEKDTPDKVWEIQHTHKNVNGERVWLDSKSQQIHGQLQQLVVEQQSEEVEHPMTREEMYSSILGQRSGYVRGFGYGKKPPRKTQMQQANIEASVSSAMEIMRQEMQADMDRKFQEELNRKLQEENEQMAIDLKREMEEDLQKKLEEERAHMRGEFDKMIQDQMAAFMTRILQGQGS
ncbi:uncharacterized protein LOC132057171 isoform X2 [Lycium ferocissimum]|uniref:uncharacterized protein LOC132057171 isoform X2 n=1 Tax=Lycium ferocissimum TaxID=112874 RepID=UPI0028160E00|nr:uncharacterized protein LOC132057171 isoform X2 [Lycium ferocissimum]